MVEGVAQYKEPGKDPFTIMIGEDAIKNMDPTFDGRPVYVQHVDDVDLSKLQEEADGYVVKSFYNKSDGKHWVEFIVVSDKGHAAVMNGWKLSNAYLPKRMGNGGEWHGLEYSKEVLEGEYEHLAIVPNPRYQESVILTPDEFKSYNSGKETELLKIANSKQGENSMLNFFKKTKVENGKELEGMMVTLPKSKKEVDHVTIINNADEHEMHKEEHMANMEHHVMVGNEKMKLNELVGKHLELKDAYEKLKGGSGDDEMHNDEDADAKKKALELAAHEEKEMAAKKANEEKAEHEKKMNADKAKKQAEFDKLKNAEANARKNAPVIELAQDQVARGKQRYGSN